MLSFFGRPVCGGPPIATFLSRIDELAQAATSVQDLPAFEGCSIGLKGVGRHRLGLGTVGEDVYRLLAATTLVTHFAACPIRLTLGGALCIPFMPDFVVLLHHRGIIVQAVDDDASASTRARLQLGQVAEALRHHGLRLVLIKASDLDACGIAKELELLERSRLACGKWSERALPVREDFNERWRVAVQACDELMEAALGREAVV